MIRLSKRLGQHHLLHPELCRPLIDFLEPWGRLVLEIGPGGGALTGELLAAGARVWGVEIDLAWAGELRRRLRSERLSLVVGDALRLDAGRLPPGSLIAGNLPFAVATTLVEQLLREAAAVARLGFLIQLEVAERLTARPGASAYGALTVITSARAEVRLLSRVGRGSFRPRPGVDSAFVGMVPRPTPLPRAGMAMFESWVRRLFGYRRKMLRNGLARLWGAPEAERVLAAAGIDGRVRPQALDLDGFVSIHRARFREPDADGRGSDTRRRRRRTGGEGWAE